MEWITDPVKPANLVMLYIEEPDTHLHALGPDSSVVKDLIRKLDNVTEYLEVCTFWVTKNKLKYIFFLDTIRKKEYKRQSEHHQFE